MHIIVTKPGSVVEAATAFEKLMKGSDKAIQHRRNAINHMINYLGLESSLDEACLLDAKVFRAYLEGLPGRTNGHLSSDTIYNYMNQVHAFMEYCEERGWIKDFQFRRSNYDSESSDYPFIDTNKRRNMWKTIQALSDSEVSVSNTLPLFTVTDVEASTIDGKYKNLQKAVDMLGLFLENACVLKMNTKCRPCVSANHAAFYALVEGIQSCCEALCDEVTG